MASSETIEFGFHHARGEEGRVSIDPERRLNADWVTSSEYYFSTQKS